MKFKTYKDAIDYWRNIHPFKGLTRVVKSSYWDMTKFKYLPCFTIIMK